MLGNEYEVYLQEIEEPVKRGFRVNTLKIDADAFFRDFKIDRIPTGFAENGFYQVEIDGHLRTLLNAAGLIYMQEPSASAAVTVLDPKPGMKILDLCAAPGSKTTQIAERMDNQGFLVANEIDANRAAVLASNVEKHGISNCLVLNADPRVAEEAFPNYFDAVLCDAPCSEEGMFRKNDHAAEIWTPQSVASCALRQAHILDSAYKMIRPGGILLYSTCTFNLHENEETVQAFIRRHSDMKIMPIQASFGRRAFDLGNGTTGALRIFPMDGGEGHFICKMIKNGQQSEQNIPKTLESEPLPGSVSEAITRAWIPSFPYILKKGTRVYGGDNPFVDPGHCRIIRHQVLLGEICKDRFEESYAGAMIESHHVAPSVDVDEEKALSYLHGNVFPCMAERGQYRITWHGYALGMGKCDGTVMKNWLPKNYRIR